MKSDIVLTDKEKAQLLKHPRLIELYIVLIYDMVYDRIGDERTLSLFKTLSTMSMIDYDRVRLLLTRYHMVKGLLKTDEERYYKEVALLGAIHGHTRYWVAKKWLHRSVASVYMKTSGVTKEELLSEDFIKSMDGEVILSASKDIYRELLRFQDVLRELSELFGS